MSRNETLADFEKRFPEDMDLEELRRWKQYFTQRAQFLQPKVKKLAMKRIHAINGAIAAKGTEE